MVIDNFAISLPVHVARMPQKGFPVVHAATERERAALAANHGLLSVESFVIDALVTRWRSEGIRLAGTITADVVQECVVTLDPVPAHLEIPFEISLVSAGSKLDRVPEGGHGEIVVDAESDDIPDTFSGDTIDAGALAEEHFELALDPYPRKPGAEFHQEGNAAGDVARPSPFAALRKLKDGDSGE